MFSLKQAIMLALAGTAIAGPLAHRDNGNYDGPRVGRLPGNWGWKIDDVTNKIVIVTPTTPQASPATTTPAVVVQATPKAQPTPAPVAASGSGTGYMAIVSKWRAAGGLPALTQSSKLEANAAETGRRGNGQMVHWLGPGSMGQVLAPGNANNFESCYVGGWLCEISTLPGLNGICGTMSQGWSHDGQTGHAKILTDPGYKTIGCALTKGIWACDLGY